MLTPFHTAPERPLPGARMALVAVLLAWAAFPAASFAAAEEAPAAEVPEAAPEPVATSGRLPAATTTPHEIAFDDRTLRFAAIAGSLTLTGAQDRPEADIAFVAYVRDSDDPAGRPVTFAVNGGPGAASAYLHLGVLGPWRLPMADGGNIVPSQPVALVDNPETWLDFTDLVFVDPVGTGFSRLVNSSDRLRGRYLSVDGDADAVADFILRWLTENGRMASPKYFVGESYGGFRGPLVAERLQTDHGAALRGMILLSPVLDFGWWQQPSYAPLPHVSLLPSLAAAGMERAGTFSGTDLRAAEDYAAGDYLTDLMRGLADEAAVARVVGRVAALTGLDPDVVERYAGRLDASGFARELARDDRRVASAYDTAITSGDPTPERPFGRAAEPVIDAMTAPLTGAMIAHYQDTLGWLPDRRYLLLNRGVNRGWDWGRGRGQPEAVSALRRVLALDPELRLLVVHGYSDLVTPYFASELILRQLRDVGAGDRVRRETYRGGHMFYTDDGSRRAFRDDARRVYAAGEG